MLKNIILILFFVLVSSCASFNATKPYTKTQAVLKSSIDELCSHSKVHQDIIMLGVSDLIEPHAVYITCNCEYGFDCNKKLDKEK